MLKSNLTFLAVGLLIGAIARFDAGGYWPQIPVHAVATQGSDNSILATGPLDEEVEAVIFLDGLTGDLKASAVGMIDGKFNAFFQHNITKDFGHVKSPKYLMTTGVASLARSVGAGNAAPSNSLVYVAEITTGQVAAYVIPWNKALRMNNQKQSGDFLPLDIFKLRTVVLR